MRKWSIACSAAMLAVGLAAPAHADEWSKLTYLTFSGPVAMPGITLPAGTYRFELADPTTSRRVIRVSDKDGSKTYGMFLSMSDRKLDPSDDPVVMFKEMPAGAPQAVQAWFYPGETYGYEFVYPHDQALKIAKATHQPVLAMKDSPTSTTDEDKMASMKSGEVTRIDENDRPVSTDEALKDSGSLHPSNAPAATTAQSNTASASTTASNTAQSDTASKSRTAPSTTANANTAQSTTAQSTTAMKPQANTAQSTTARSTTASRANAARNTHARANTANDNRAVGTSGQTAGSDAAQSNTASRSSRRSLPRTAGELPLMELLSGLALAGGFSLRAFRRR